MKKQLPIYFFILFLFSGAFLFSQNESKKWYFGAFAGLDFMTSPPTVLTNGAMTTSEGCAAVADAAGNLLFYTDGSTVYNSSHLAMANGTGLQGFSSSSQSGIIVKQPGNTNIYFVFTQGANINGLKYSIVDMSLSSGSGSVTAKNVLLTSPSSEKLTSVRHCNGADTWVVVHDQLGTSYRAFLVSSGGVNTTAVVSSIGVNYTGIDFIGCIKLSPNGRKMATALYGTSAGYEICDFDNATGVVSNPLYIGPGFQVAYGVEFSPDGTKLYGSRYSGSQIYQWDLCAGSPTAIVASQYTVCGATGAGKGQIQLASDGKMYIARASQTAIAVISNPNVAGSGCNFVEVGQSIAPKQSTYGLPNFITSGFAPLTPPFTYTVSNAFGACNTASFNPPAIVQTFTTVGCSASGYSLTGFLWNFGDPGSGSANTSTLNSPAHTYMAVGNYTASLIVYYSCGGGTDTVKQVININNPCISVTSTSITCANLGSATVAATGGIGPFSYTWMPGAQTSSVATGLSPGSYTITVLDQNNNYTYSSTATFNSLIPLTGQVVGSNSVSCYGAATGTGAIVNINGGSGSQTYLWNNGTTTYTTATPNTLSAGIWTASITDALTGCNFGQTLFITQPPAATLQVSANTPSACIGGSVVLTGTNSGGTPGYTYTWTAGPATNTAVVSQPASGAYVYTLNSTDSKNCVTSKTISVDFVGTPTLTVANVSVCPLKTGTLTAGGATSYTWNGSSTGSTFTDNPLSDTEYTVVGSVAGCTSVATASIILKPVPSPVLSSNSPVCNGQALHLSGSGGSSYSWSGPPAFTSALQNPTINPAGTNNSGTYQATVTAANTCTATAGISVTVNPTPTLSTTGGTVCTSQTLHLNSASVAGATYAWTGPNAFTSSSQNVVIANPTLSQSGNYSVLVTSAAGCTNAAVVSASVVAPPVLSLLLSGNSTLCAQALNNSRNTLTLSAFGALTYTISTPAGIANSNPSGPTSTLSPAAPYNTGAYTASVQGSNGICSSTTSITFSVIPNPVIAINASNPVICYGDSYSYFVSGADTYTWFPGIPGLSTYTAASTVATPTLTSVYPVVGSSLGCNSSTQSSTLTVNPLPVVSISPNPAVICLHSPVTLTASGTGSAYSWSPFAWLSSSQGATVSANPPAQQSYTVVASLNGCVQSTVITVSVIPLPEPAITVLQSVFCINGELSLEATGGVSYVWTTPGNYQSFTGQMLQLTLSSLVYNGTYTLTATGSNGCRNTATTDITVKDSPNGYLETKQTEGCVPFYGYYQFMPVNQPLSDIVALNWQMNGRPLSEENKFSYYFPTAGEYTIRGNITSVNGCANTVSLQVSAHPVPQAGFSYSPEHPVENVDEVIFTNTSSGNQLHTFNWHFIDNDKANSVKYRDASYVFTTMGIYPVAMIVTNAWGCSDSVVRTIKIDPDLSVYVPNAFTPNADGKNELFYPVTRGVKLYSFAVFNRWGALLFSTSDVAQGWDGSYKGQPCKEDVYAWKVTVSGVNGQQKELAGTVILYR